MSIQDLKLTLSITDERIAEILAIIAPHEESLSKLRKIRDGIKEKISTKKVEEIQNRSVKEKAEFYLNSVDLGSAVYEGAEKFFKHNGLRIDGYDPLTNQYVLEIAMNESKSNLDAVENMLLFMLPLITPVDGKIKFSIFEHTCSLHDSYWLIFDTKTGKWMCITGSARRRKRAPEFESDSLTSVLAYICKNRYYIPVEDSY